LDPQIDQGRVDKLQHDDFDEEGLGFLALGLSLFNVHDLFEQPFDEHVDEDGTESNSKYEGILLGFEIHELAAQVRQVVDFSFVTLLEI
jgi:hypothetical protein